MKAEAGIETAIRQINLSEIPLKQIIKVLFYEKKLKSIIALIIQTAIFLN